MKALILNSGLGSRMGGDFAELPKCMSELSPHDTIVSRQLSLLEAFGIHDIVMTTGKNAGALQNYIRTLGIPVTFVHNPEFRETNYIYSIYCARDHLRGQDILLMHGDLVYSAEVLSRVLCQPDSCMTVSSAVPLPEKDFKAVIHNNRIEKVGIEFFEDCLAAQPLYLIRKDDWNVWLDAICAFIEKGERKCYAEKAMNTVSDRMTLRPLDVGTLMCGEVDTLEDLAVMQKQVSAEEDRTVYMCFSSDILHAGHFAILRKAAALGRLVIGIMTDEAIASYKRYPLLPYEERAEMLRSIKGVSQVIPQKTLSYHDVVTELKPAIVVHGNDWLEGIQRPVRDELIRDLTAWGGRLIEFEYNHEEEQKARESRLFTQLGIPDMRRSRLKKLIAMKQLVTATEVHSGLTGLIAEKTVVLDNDGKPNQFDAMWLSSLTDSTEKGKPDIELVDMSSRLKTIDDIMEVTTKPMILDGDTGGRLEHFVYNVRTLERVGVSAVIIEDKTGLKKNSLFGTEAQQTQDTIENFCAKIAAGKAAQKTADFMIIARIESLILEQGMEDALKRARAYVAAGADGVMIHSRRKEPDEIFEFLEKFRAEDKTSVVVVVPTSFNQVTETEFRRRGVNIVIYANQLIRSAFPAMKHTAETILKCHRAQEADAECMPIKEILTLIPDKL